MKRPAIASADGRPRIHLRQTNDGARYRFGATGMDHHAPTLGEAFEAAVHGVGGRDAVFIFEGAQHG